jgi:UDP-glucose 4-epimerase
MSQPIAVVTGGAGFIGSHAVDNLLQRGFAVRIIDNLRSGRIGNIEHIMERADVEFIQTDICQLPPDCPTFAEVDLVLHFAGIGDIVPSIEQPEKYMRNNVLGTVRVLEAARFHEVRRLVFAASSSCYGANPPTPTDESAPIVTDYPYALSKYQGEQAAFHWAHIYGMSINAIRIFNAYGVRSRTSGAYGAVMGVFLKQKLEGAPYTVVGDGEQSRDFVYVTDVAEAFVLAGLTSHTGRVWNLGSGKPQSINRLVDLLGGSAVYLPKRPGEPDVTWANITAIQDDLGWKPIISFEDGVKNMLNHIEYWSDAPLWDRKLIANATKAWFEALGADGQVP